jgi:hypothetical protein
MTKIESNELIIQHSAENIYTFLSDFNNFGKLMPERVNNWSSDSDHCEFTIGGLGDMAMHIVERTPSSRIKMINSGKAPFNFVLTCFIEAQEVQCIVKLTLEAEMNPMVKLMAERPLGNFLNMLVEKLQSLQLSDL